MCKIRKRSHFQICVVSLAAAFVAAGVLLCAQCGYAQVLPVGSSATPQPAVPDSVVQVVAEAQGLACVPADQVPPWGTFWLVTPVGKGGVAAVPLPCPPDDPTLPIYAITTDGQEFLVDGTCGQVFPSASSAAKTASSAVVTSAVEMQANTVSDLIAQVQGAQVASPMARSAMSASESPPSFGDSGSGGYTPDGASYITPNYGTNLWIAQTAVGSGYMTGIASNTLGGVNYIIQSVTNLAQTQSGWQYEQTIIGSYLTNWTPLGVQQFNRQNLFIRLQSELSTDGSGIPDWWEAQYGLTNVDPGEQDSAGDGYTVYQKYVLGVNPSTWVTPFPPQGVKVSYNAAGGIATLNWLPSPGNVTGYTVEKSYTYAWSNTVQDFSTPVASYSDNVSANYPNPWQAGTISVSYTVQAHYAGGNSAQSAAAPLEAASFAGSINSNPQGGVVLTVEAMPANTTGLRLTEVDWGAINDNDFADAYVTNFIIAVTNASSLSIALANVQTANSDSEYAWEGQAIQSDGNESANANLDGTFEGDGSSTALMEPPFNDERIQLKQNLIFQLRAAAMDTPLHFSIPFTNSDDPDYGNYGVFGAYVGDYQYPQAYAYAGFYQFANYTYDANYGVLDPFLPSEENCLFRNFVFTPANADENGTLTTGVGFGTGVVGVGSPEDDAITLVRPLAYQFQTNWIVFPDLLQTNTSNWTFYDGTGEYDGFYWTGGVTFDYAAGGIIMTNNLRNWFGLPLTSATVAYNDEYTGNLETNIVLAGGESILPPYDILNVMPNNIYAEAAQPNFQLREYDFWNPNPVYNANANAYVYALPGAPGFSTTNQGARFFAGVGSQIQIAGYAKLEVANSVYSGVYGYLGQYFLQAYTMTNGVATSSNTGVLSPYGNFLATQPGEAALVTMPDVDTGLQGTCSVYCVSLNVDKNHDGHMDLSFNGPDATSANSPFEFWVNNGNDQPDSSIGGGLDYDSPVPPAPPNYAPAQFYPIGSISCPRDLENFARLWLCGLPAIGTNYQVTLGWQNFVGNPAINLYNSVETNGGTGYLSDTNIAHNQCLATAYGSSAYSFAFKGPSIAIASISPATSFTFPANTLTNSGNQYFLFEGAGVGSGELTMTITDINSNTVAQSGVWLDLHDIKDFYEGARITNNFLGAISNWSGSIQSVRQASTSALGTDTNLIVWVHGINVPYWNWLDAGDTIFKRLYWAGYGGKFMAAEWPCLIGLQLADFNSSELRAYKASTGLTNYLSQLRSRFPGYRVNLFAHSQGNALVGEAIREGATFDTYILTEGAMPASCYDISTAGFPALTNQENYVPTPQLQPMGYQGVYANFTGHIVNFYNFYDPVLDIWLADQIELKPNEFAFNGGNYGYIGTNSYHFIENGPTLLVTDPQESRAMVSRSLTLPIGQIGPTTQHGVIESGVDLHASYGFYNAMPDDHSAQWTWPIQRALPYYQQVVLEIQPIQ